METLRKFILLIFVIGLVFATYECTKTYIEDRIKEETNNERFYTTRYNLCQDILALKEEEQKIKNNIYMMNRVSYDLEAEHGFLKHKVEPKYFIVLELSYKNKFGNYEFISEKPKKVLLTVETTRSTYYKLSLGKYEEKNVFIKNPVFFECDEDWISIKIISKYLTEPI